MRDIDVRAALREQELKKFFDDGVSRVVEEFGLCQGQVRVDVAVINGSLHGYEIKSDKDTLERLPSQVEAYSRVLDYSTLVVGDHHIEKAISSIPEWWGVLNARPAFDGVQLHWLRTPRLNPAPDLYAMAQLLWREESMAFLASKGLGKGFGSKPRSVLWRNIAEVSSYEELSAYIRRTLKARSTWRQHETQPQRPKKLSPREAAAQRRRRLA